MNTNVLFFGASKFCVCLFVLSFFLSLSFSLRSARGRGRRGGRRRVRISQKERDGINYYHKKDRNKDNLNLVFIPYPPSPFPSPSPLLSSLHFLPDRCLAQYLTAAALTCIQHASSCLPIHTHTHTQTNNPAYLSSNLNVKINIYIPICFILFDHSSFPPSLSLSCRWRGKGEEVNAKAHTCDEAHTPLITHSRCYCCCYYTQSLLHPLSLK